MILAILNLHVTLMAPIKFQLNPKKVREKSRECHNHKQQPLPDPKRKRKPTKLNKHKPNKRMKSTKISSLFPKRGNCNTKRTEKHKNKMTHGKTYNKLPRRILSVQEEMLFEEFEDGCHRGLLGYRNRMILAILNLHVTLMSPIKFQLNLTFGSGGDVI